MEFADAFNRPFCVYAHKTNEQIIYIGSGPIARAFSTVRSKLWKDAIAGQSVTVVILGWFDERFDAYEYEGQMIDHHRPKCNLASVRGCGVARALPKL